MRRILISFALAVLAVIAAVAPVLADSQGPGVTH
jgi:hypothetical protein